jgi:Flp pilus assembly protein TadD
MATTPASLPQGPHRARFRVAVALRAALLGSVLAWAVPAVADDLAAIQKLIRKGETTQAIEQLDAHLRTAPDDPQARFLKGVALADSGRRDEAIAVFLKLTEDHPELPESYNNLAVLYAQQGLYERARQALEMAIQANPSYAIAYENLGDLHVRLASQAYDKAARLDARNKSAPRKLALARDLLAPPAKAPAKAAPATEAPGQ